MINVKYNQKGANYIVSFSGLGDRIVTGKFDTGAVATIITSKKLGLTDGQVEILKGYFEKSGVEPENFYSATNGKMGGYLVRAKNIMLYSTVLESFYYYLVLDNSLDKALLGDDFISCCTFSHQPKGDIVITTIDMNLYSSPYKNNMDCVDISEIIREDLHAKHCSL